MNALRRCCVYALLVVLAGAAVARTLNVPAVFATIQSAIDAADAGDEVRVAAGVYEGKVLLRGGVRLTGAGEDLTTLTRDAPLTVISVLGAGANSISDLTVDGGGTVVIGIFCGAGSVTTITSCTIRDTAIGIQCHEGSEMVIDHVTVQDTRGAGISVHGSRATIRDSLLVNLRGQGVVFDNSQGVVVDTVMRDVLFGVTTVGTATPTISNCRIDDCTVGIEARGDSRPIVRSCAITHTEWAAFSVAHTAAPDLGTLTEPGLNRFSGGELLEGLDRRVDGATPVSAIGNWWGVATPTEEMFMGNINYSPWLPTPDARPPVVSLSTLPDAIRGRSYTFDVSAVVQGLDGTPAYAAAGLPAGLAIEATTGTLSGAPEEVGTFSVLLSVTDDLGLPGSTEVVLVVAPPPVITLGVSSEDALIDGTVTVAVRIDTVSDLAGYEFALTYDPAVLTFVEIAEGDVLGQAGAETFWQAGDVGDGAVTGITNAILQEGGVDGGGVLFTAQFATTGLGETDLTITGTLGDSEGSSIPFDLVGGYVIVRTYDRWDVTQDGAVDIADIVIVAQAFGQTHPANEDADINSDGVVNILDVILVARHLGETTGQTAAAPRLPTAAHGALLRGLLAEAEAIGHSAARDEGVDMLRRLLAALPPQVSAVLPNYPNPFNPETWIPFDLAEPADVSLRLYDTRGLLVRSIDLGRLDVGAYRDRANAAHWDGRSDTGESVASGVYILELRAGDTRQTRRLTVRK
jgi:hypothetical protein